MNRWPRTEFVPAVACFHGQQGPRFSMRPKKATGHVRGNPITADEFSEMPNRRKCRLRVHSVREIKCGLSGTDHAQTDAGKKPSGSRREENINDGRRRLPFASVLAGGLSFEAALVNSQARDF